MGKGVAFTQTRRKDMYQELPQPILAYPAYRMARFAWRTVRPRSNMALCAKENRQRIESRKGLRQLSHMKEMEMGNDQYELITV